MPSQSIQSIVKEVCVRVSDLYPGEKIEAILFGSYARGDADEHSDVDILLLVDSPREMIAEHNWQIGKIASDLFFEYDLVISPIVENRKFFFNRIHSLPFYANIDREGVRISA